MPGDRRARPGEILSLIDGFAPPDNRFQLSEITDPAPNNHIGTARCLADLGSAADQLGGSARGYQEPSAALAIPTMAVQAGASPYVYALAALGVIARFCMICG